MTIRFNDSFTYFYAIHGSKTMMRSLALGVFGMILLLSSCTVEKRKFQSGYHIQWNADKTNSSTQQVGNPSVRKYVQLPQEHSASELHPASDAYVFVDQRESNVEFVQEFIDRKEALKVHQPENSPKPDTTAACDNIILLKGDEIQAKIIEISGSEIRYKKSDHLNGPDYVLNKCEVFMIKYPNGTKDIITPADGGQKPRKTPGLAIAGLSVGVLGLIIGGIPFGLLGIIFGFSAYGKVMRDPAKYKGKGLALASIILGLLDVLLVLAILFYII